MGNVYSALTNAGWPDQATRHCDLAGIPSFTLVVVSGANHRDAMENNEVGQRRKHDYVLQCYLEAFAFNSNNESQLYVVDSVTERALVTTPQKVAAGRNFNLMRADEEKSNPIESGQADFESKLAPALVRMNDKGDFSHDADRAVILRLMALLAVLNPCRTEQTIRRQVDVAIAHPQAWESQRKKAAAGVEGAADLTFEELRYFSKRGDYTFAPPTTKYVAQQLQLVSTVYNLLLQRSWQVARAAPASGGHHFG